MVIRHFLGWSVREPVTTLRRMLLTTATIVGLVGTTLLLAAPATAASTNCGFDVLGIPFVCATAQGDPTHPGFVIPEGRHWARRADTGTNGWLYADATQVDTCSIQPLLDNWCFTSGNALDDSTCHSVTARTESFDVDVQTTTNIGSC